MHPELSPTPVYRPWLHRWAVLTAVTAVLLVMLSGALVTSRRAGMIDIQAVRSPWYFFTLVAEARKSSDFWGYLATKPLHLIEHGHRQVGWILGAMAIVLALWCWLYETRRWMRWMGFACLLAVGSQGVLGIFRVAENSVPWAMVHGISAQCVIGLLFATALFTSPSWLAGSTTEGEDVAKCQRLTLLTTLLIFAQIIVGVWLRQLALGLYVHMVLALAVAAHVLMLYGRVSARIGAGSAWLRAPITILSALLMLQIALGFWVWLIGGGTGAFDPEPSIPWRRSLLATAHVGIGAMMLSASLIATLRAFRHLRPALRPAIELQASGGAA